MDLRPLGSRAARHLSNSYFINPSFLLVGTGRSAREVGYEEE